MAGRRARDNKGTEACEYPRCKNTGTDLEFISYAVNPKTRQKGMVLCPHHAAIEIKRQHDN
jgi:hypothetical protein